MPAESTIAPGRHAPELLGQTVVVIGGSAGIGLETARRAREEGADVILTARDRDRLHRIGLELGASISAFDISDVDRLTRFFANLPGLVDPVLASGSGPHYVPFAGLHTATIRQGVQFSASGVSWSSCVAERASWLAKKRTASAILCGSANASGATPGRVDPSRGWMPASTISNAT